MASVYVMTNIAMPGLVKVGWADDVNSRAQQLSSHTGVPTGFEVAYSVEVDDAFDVEQFAHRILAELRVNPRREFFYIKSASAIKAVQVAALMSAWNKASPEAREEFMRRVDTPVMDRRYS